MPLSLPRDVAEIGIRLLDDAHMVWIAAEADSEHAFSAWSQGPAADRTKAYLAYRAALDREEAAALDLQRLSELAHPCRELLTQSSRPSARVRRPAMRKRS
jgi:hypothetical protein